jgi:hypothetical protein
LGGVYSQRRLFVNDFYQKSLSKSFFILRGKPLQIFFGTFANMAKGNPNPKPPRRKKKLGRHRGGDRKQTTYDHDATRESLGLLANANAQEIAFAASAGNEANTHNNDARVTESSALKREYNAMLIKERARNQELAAKAEKAEKVVESKQRKIMSLKDENKLLAAALREEKTKSRLTILKLISDAELIIAEANEIKFSADEKLSAAELELQKEREKMQSNAEKQREYMSVREATRELISYVPLSYLAICISNISLVKQKHKQEMLKAGGEHERQLKSAEDNLQKNKEQWKKRLAAVQEQIAKEREKWQSKLDALNEELSVDIDRVYQEKARRRAQVREQLDETARVQMILQNYVDSLEEENEELRTELKDAIKDKCAAVRTSEKDRRNAKARLDKWHAERYLRRQAEDYAAEQEKINRSLQETLKKFQDVPQDTKLVVLNAAKEGRATNAVQFISQQRQLFQHPLTMSVNLDFLCTMMPNSTDGTFVRTQPLVGHTMAIHLFHVNYNIIVYGMPLKKPSKQHKTY